MISGERRGLDDFGYARARLRGESKCGSGRVREKRGFEAAIGVAKRLAG